MKLEKPRSSRALEATWMSSILFWDQWEQMKSFQNRNDIIQLAFSEVTPTAKLELDSHWAAGSGNGLVGTDTAEAKAPCSPTEHPQSSEDRKVLTTTVPGKRIKYFAQSPCSSVEVFIYKSQFRKHLASRYLPSLGFPGGSAVKNPPVYSGDTGSIPGSGRSPGEENGYSL